MALWKILNGEDAVLIPKIEARTFPADFCTPLIVVSLGHSDITRFRPRSPIAPDRKSFGSRLTKKIPKVAQTTGTVDVFDPCSGISGPTSRRVSACPNLHE